MSTVPEPNASSAQRPKRTRNFGPQHATKCTSCTKRGLHCYIVEGTKKCRACWLSRKGCSHEGARRGLIKSCEQCAQDQDKIQCWKNGPGFACEACVEDMRTCSLGPHPPIRGTKRSNPTQQIKLQGVAGLSNDSTLPKDTQEESQATQGPGMANQLHNSTLSDHGQDELKVGGGIVPADSLQPQETTDLTSIHPPLVNGGYQPQSMYEFAPGDSLKLPGMIVPANTLPRMQNRYGRPQPEQLPPISDLVGTLPPPKINPVARETLEDDHDHDHLDEHSEELNPELEIQLRNLELDGEPAEDRQFDLWVGDKYFGEEEEKSYEDDIGEQQHYDLDNEEERYYDDDVDEGEQRYDEEGQSNGVEGQYYDQEDQHHKEQHHETCHEQDNHGYLHHKEHSEGYHREHEADEYFQEEHYGEGSQEQHLEDEFDKVEDEFQYDANEYHNGIEEHGEFER